VTDAERTDAEAASATTSPTPPGPVPPGGPEPRPASSEDARQLAIARLLAAGRRWLRPAGGSP
jgi:hypothetical protein